MDYRSLMIATAVGTALQIGMVIAGHQVESLKPFFGPGGMLLSLAAGILYVWLAGGAWGPVLAGSAVAGGICALLGIAVSHALGDVPASLLALGTTGSAVAGLAGGALAKAIF